MTKNYFISNIHIYTSNILSENPSLSSGTEKRERGLKTKQNYRRESMHRGSTSRYLLHLQLFQEFVCTDEVRYIYRASFICKRTELCSAGMLTSTFQDDVASKEIFALDTAGPL